MLHFDWLIDRPIIAHLLREKKEKINERGSERHTNNRKLISTRMYGFRPHTPWSLKQTTSFSFS
jgi:hypothetical protein